MCVRACVRAHVRAWVRAYVRAVYVCVRGCFLIVVNEMASLSALSVYDGTSKS